MKQKQGSFSPGTVFLGLAAASLSRFFLQAGAGEDARLFLLWGFLAALALCLLSALLTAEFQAQAFFSGQSILSRVGCGAFLLWFVSELARTVLAVQQICWEQFSSLAVLSALPFLLWAGWVLPENTFDRSARVLWWLAGLSVVLCLAGLSGQLHWENLFAANGTLPTTEWRWDFFPDYAALALLCPPCQWKKTIWMPLGVFAVQFVFCFGAALLFGARQGNTLWGLELLRAGTLGGFSRFDAVFLLLWLAVMFFRICLLARVVRLLWVRLPGAPQEVDV